MSASFADAGPNLSHVSQWLAAEHEHMLAILNQLRVGVLIINGEGIITFVSKAAERLFEQDCSEALGRPWQEILPLDGSTIAQLEGLIDAPGDARTGIAVQWYSATKQRFRMELDISDDPHDPSNRIFFFYDVSEVADLRSQLKDLAHRQGLCGQSRAMLAVYREIQVLARGDTTVLIEGETGTGKELVARAVHNTSARKDRPFLAVNCAGLSESLLGSQLFGHKRGSFTGAIADQIGLFEAAHGGTLFLDEIGDMPASVQSSLLRVLQQKEFTRLGETQPRKVDVRIIAATHRDLEGQVATGNFRADLFYRIRVARISLPPLRERLDDLPILIAEFLGQACESRNTPVPDIAAEVMGIFRKHRWPGNVRELMSAVEFALIHSDGRIIQPYDLPPEITDSLRVSNRLDTPEGKERVLTALKRADGNRTEAARLLGVSRATFYRVLSRLNLSPGA